MNREPIFWLDKVCIDQKHLADGLCVLPVSVMAWKPETSGVNQISKRTRGTFDTALTKFARCTSHATVVLIKEEECTVITLVIKTLKDTVSGIESCFIVSEMTGGHFGCSCAMSHPSL